MVNKRERLSEQDPAADRPARLPGTGPEGRPQKHPRPDPKACGSLWLRWPVGGSSPWWPVSSPAPGWGDGDSERGREWEEAGRPTPPPLGGSTALPTPRTQSLQLAVVSGLQTVRTSCCSSHVCGRRLRRDGRRVHWGANGAPAARGRRHGGERLRPLRLCVCVSALTSAGQVTCQPLSSKSSLTQLQIQPHTTPDPTTPSSKTKTTQHQTQPPTATNPTPLSTKSNLTQQQILTHPTPAQAYATPNPTSPNKKFNLTQLEIQPHTTPNPTLPSS